MVGPVTTATTAWMDRWWDDDAGLLWNPPGSFEGVVEPRSVHLVRETAWYAIGLLRRAGPRDRDRAEAAIDTVVGHQYHEPGQPWHGTFVRFPEWAPPTEGATEWIDYDPNWRQFLGTALAVAITDFDLSPSLAARARDAVHLAVEAEPSDRVPPSYANIALLRGVAGHVGGSGRRRIRRRDRRQVPASRVLQRVRLAHLLRDRPAGARALAAPGCPWRAATRRCGGGGRPVGRHRPLVACRAREPVRSVLAGLRHGPRHLRERALPRAVVRRPARPDAIAGGRRRAARP